MALARTSVANTLIIQSLSPFIAGLGGWLCLGEHVRRRTWVAMGVALLGTVVRLWGSAGAGSRIGDVLALVTATATVVVRWHRTVPMPAAAALAAALAAVIAAGRADPSSATAGDLALLALFGIGQLGAGLLLFTAGARLIPGAEASLIAVLESVLGPVWVWLAVGERPGAFSLVGGGGDPLGADRPHGGRPRSPAPAPGRPGRVRGWPSAPRLATRGSSPAASPTSPTTPGTRSSSGGLPASPPMARLGRNGHSLRSGPTSLGRRC